MNKVHINPLFQHKHKEKGIFISHIMNIYVNSFILDSHHLNLNKA